MFHLDIFKISNPCRCNQWNPLVSAPLAFVSITEGENHSGDRFAIQGAPQDLVLIYRNNSKSVPRLFIAATGRVELERYINAFEAGNYPLTLSPARYALTLFCPEKTCNATAELRER